MAHQKTVGSDTKDGPEFDRKKYGTRRFMDNMDQPNQQNNRRPMKVKNTGEGMLARGYTTVTAHIPEANQSAFQDDGKHEKDVASKTFSGHAKGLSQE